MNDDTALPAAFVGIDWADQKHDIYLYPTADSKACHQVVDAKPEALQEWILQMRERFAGAPIYVCLEQSKGALIYQLLEYDFFVLFPVNPKTLASFRQAFFPSGAKGDPSDADLLAELVRVHHQRLRRWKPDTTQTRLLAALCQKRRKAVQARVRLLQELRAELKAYFPLVLELFPSLETRLACEFLRRWPTLPALRQSKPDTIRRFCYARGCRRIEQLNAFLAALPKAVEVTTDPAVIEPAALNVQMFAGQLRAMLPVIEEFDRQIAQHFQAHPEAAIFESFPGAGPQLAPRLATAFGTDRERLHSAEQMSVFSGVAPVRIASGQSSVIKKRWACPKFLRQTFHEFAACSIPHCPWAKKFYDDQRRKNKKHHTAVRALAFKWMRVLYACWKNRVPYDDTVYNQKLHQHASAFAC